MRNNILLISLFILACSNNNAEKNTASSSTDTKAATTESDKNNSPAPQGDGIIGDWKLTLETYDENQNKKLDDEERKKAKPNHYFYRFYPDGKCLINFTTSAAGAFKGHYEKTTGANNKERLKTYLDDGESKGAEGDHYIISVIKDELVMLDALGEYTFWIFKREK